MDRAASDSILLAVQHCNAYRCIHMQLCGQRLGELDNAQPKTCEVQLAAQ